MKPLHYKKHTLAKRGLSLLCVLALCLTLLPVTALAAEGAPNNLFVGDQNVRSGENISYWITNDSGGLEPSDANANWNVKYDLNSATLTLRNAIIKTTHSNSQGAVIYAESVESSAVSLTIQLEGENTIKCDSASYGIYVDAQMSDTRYGTSASLTITGEGSLNVSGSSYGIYVKSGSGDASLTIEEASVNVNTTLSYGYNHGVYVMSGTYATSSPVLSLAVNGGSLTTSGSASGEGIKFYVGANKANSATTSLTVTDNAIVDARTGGISASGVSVNPNVDIGSTDSTGGIVFDDKEGTVYGNVTLDESLTINQGETLTIPEGSTLTVPEGKILTNNGTIDNSGTLTNNGTVTNNGTLNVNEGGKLEGETTGGSGTVVNTPTITAQPESQSVTEGNTATFTVAATGENLSYQWQQSTDNGQSWTNISGAISSTYTTDAATLAMNNYQYQCVVSNSAGSVTSSAAPLTVNAATVSVTGVSLDKDTLSLYTGDTASLTATVAPDNATNKNVTWSSDKLEVATVENGKVTAKAAGTATITVTTEDGNKTATCTVTVKEPPYTGKYSYELTTSVGDHGSLSVDRYATEGDEVTITVTPDEAYKLDDLSVTAGGKEVALTAGGDGTYTFTMPSADVKITATFAEDPDWTEPEEPATDVSDIFLDVAPNAWYKDAVQYAYAGGLMTGVSANEFAPEQTTTRAMIVSMLARLEGVESANNAGFADVSNEWYATAVNWAANVGVVNGYEDGTFQPNTAITREQLAAILMNYAQYKGQDVSARADLNGYTDQPSTWAEEAMQWAVAEELITGVTNDELQPQSSATRAQVAAILQRFLCK